MPAPLGAREPGPPAEGLAGGSDRCVYLVERRCAHAPDDLLGGAIHRFPEPMMARLAAERGDPTVRAALQEAIA